MLAPMPLRVVRPDDFPNPLIASCDLTLDWAGSCGHCIPIGIEQLLPRLLPYGLRHFAWMIKATKVYRFAKALHKFNARRAASNVGFDLRTAVWRQFQIEIIG